MLRCLDGVKHLLAVVVNCCDSEIYKQPRGLENPEALARETVCMSLKTDFQHCTKTMLHFNVINDTVTHWAMEDMNTMADGGRGRFIKRLHFEGPLQIIKNKYFLSTLMVWKYA